MAFNMPATLRAAALRGFSESARWAVQRRRHARGDAQRRGPRAVFARRAAHDGAERPAERAEAREPDVEADLRDGAVGLAQERHRPFDPAPLQVAVRGLAE